MLIPPRRTRARRRPRRPTQPRPEHRRRWMHEAGADWTRYAAELAHDDVPQPRPMLAKDAGPQKHSVGTEDRSLPVSTPAGLGLPDLPLKPLRFEISPVAYRPRRDGRPANDRHPVRILVKFAPRTVKPGYRRSDMSVRFSVAARRAILVPYERPHDPQAAAAKTFCVGVYGLTPVGERAQWLSCRCVMARR
jgi:hypothetical protein